MSFGTYPLGFAVNFANPEAKGAGAYVFWVVTFANQGALPSTGTVTIHSVVSDKGRAMKRLVRVPSANRVMEVWTIKHSTGDIQFNAALSEEVAGSYGVFVVHGVDDSTSSSAFGAVFTATNNVANSSTLNVSDAVYDSYVLDFFAMSNVGILTPASDQVPIGSSSLDTTRDTALSVSMKESYPGTVSMTHTSSVTGEMMHAAVVVRSMFRRDPEYLGALEDETAERSFLAQIGAAEESASGWTQETAIPPAVNTTTTSNTSPVTHDSTGFTSKLAIVNVFSTTASSAVSYAGVKMRLFLRQQNIEWWFMVNPPATGSVAVTNTGTIEHIIVRTITSANDIIPIRADFFAASGTDAFIFPWQPGIEWKDDLLLDAAKVNAAVTATPWSPAVQTSQVQNAGKTYLSSRTLVTSNAANSGGWTWTGSQAYDRISIAVAPTMGSQIYSKTFSRVITGGKDLSGIQRIFDHVEVNGQEQLRQPLLASMMMQGANGSYFYDTATDKIYFRTPTAQSPLTFASVTVEFFILVGNRLVDFLGGNYYDPRLTGQLPSISGQANDLVFGVTAYPNGTIDLLNTDRFFDLYSSTWYWKNREVNFFFGSENLDEAQFRQVGGMLIDDVQPGYETVAFQLRAQGNTLQSNLLQTTLGSYFSPSELAQNSDLRSEFFPYTVGKVNNVEAKFFIDVRTLGPSAYPYRYFSGTFSSTPPRAVRAVHKTTGVITELTLLTDWFYFGLSVGTVPAYNPETYVILVDIGDTPAYAGETLRQLLLRAGVPLDQIDAHAFALVDQEEPFEIAIFEDQQMTIEVAVRLIEKSTFLHVYTTADGIWSVRQWIPSADDFDVLPAISDSNLKEIPDPHFQPITPFFEFIIQYDYEPYYQTFSEESSAQLDAIGLYKTTETFFRRTCLVKQEDANLIALRYHAIQLTKPTTFELEEVGFNLLDLVIFDRFRLSLNRAPNLAGFWDNEVVQILEFTKTFNPEGIHVVVDNMRGLGAGVKVAAEDGGSDWDASNSLDRIRYAFSADDDTERVDVTDPTTEGQAFAW